MNRRRLIRAYIANLLAKNLDDVSVFHSRRIPFEKDDGSRVVNVSIEKEESELFAKSPIELKKRAELSIEILVSDDEDGNSDDLVDSMTAQIEEIIHFDESFHNLIDECVLKQTETHYVREGEEERGMARMIYEVTYFSMPKPVTDLEDFTEASVHFQKKEVA